MLCVAALPMRASCILLTGQPPPPSRPGAGNRAARHTGVQLFARRGARGAGDQDHRFPQWVRLGRLLEHEIVGEGVFGTYIALLSCGERFQFEFYIR
jgi:hypothetical protein